MTVTAVANNLGPCFFDPDWTLWLERDRCHLVIGFQVSDLCLTYYESLILFRTSKPRFLVTCIFQVVST